MINLYEKQHCLFSKNVSLIYIYIWANGIILLIIKFSLLKLQSEMFILMINIIK